MTLLSDPLADLQVIFEAQTGTPGNTDALRTGTGVSVAPALEAALGSPDASAAVPSLNARRHEEIPTGALVRFYGMVQDVRDPEFYVGAYDETAPGGETRIRTGKYRDAVDPQPNCTLRPRDDATWQRTPVVCVPVPTQTEWVARVLASADAGAASASAPARADAAAPRKPKRGVEEESVPVVEDMDTDLVAAPKKTRPEKGDVQCEPCDGVAVAVAAAARTASAGATGDPWSRAATGSYLVKLYDQPDDCELRVNDLVEIFGVLELDGEADTSVPVGGACSAPESVLMAAAAEERALRPPPSAQPRLHCIVFRKLPAQHHPLLPPPNTREEQMAAAAAKAQVQAVRPVLLAALTSALGGDALAAEYTLLSCISRVIGRHGEAALGKLHVNISGCPPPAAGAAVSPAAASLRALLGEVLPLCGALPLSIGALNGTTYAPAKDHDANVLRSGALQLPLGATLLLDEAMMAAGKLDERGIANLRALTTLLDTQKVGFDFTYCTVDIGTDATVLSLSCGKSMLPLPCRVALRLEPVVPPAPPELQQPAWLDAARLYIGVAARACPQTNIPEALTGAMQDDFVASRRASPDIGADDFARWLTVTRLLAGSTLDADVSADHYARAKQLEAARCERLKESSVQL